MMTRGKSTISIGVLAREAAVSPDTLRHYERLGVLPPPARAANGYRAYPASAVDRVRLVRRALSVGFTLKELARILEERDRGGAPCRGVRALAAEKLTEVEKRLGELSALHVELQELIREWDQRLSSTRADKRAGLLESLATRPSPSHRLDRPLSSRKPRRRNS